MWQPKSFAVYIMSNRPRGVLYTGVTSDLAGRVSTHREAVIDGFTKKYNCKRLVWFESHDDAAWAILREKRIKRWRRDWKIQLIETVNPRWEDLWNRINGSVEGPPKV